MLHYLLPPSVALTLDSNLHATFAADVAVANGQKVEFSGLGGGIHIEAGTGLLKSFISSIEEFRISSTGVGLPTGSIISIDGLATTTSRNNLRESASMLVNQGV